LHGWRISEDRDYSTAFWAVSSPPASSDQMPPPRLLRERSTPSCLSLR